MYYKRIMIGPPGSGKTLLARCLPGILPDMSIEEALEATKIHSIAGGVGSSLLTRRPFRSPHHTASSVALIGGGKNATPGEISKAHNGVLFLDELPEYKRDVLEALRQPLEDGFVTIARVTAQSTYPSQFMMVCSMNPCPCGFYGSRDQQCRCTPNEIRRYLAKVSGPLLDRIDLHIEVESVPVEQIASGANEEPSRDVKQRVNAARAIQRERFAGEDTKCNAQLDAKNIDKYIKITKAAKQMLTDAAKAMGMSSRAYSRILKVSRTIADLDGANDIDLTHIAEAVQYRTLDRKYWG